MYQISKRFNLEFGHRVWSQELDPTLSHNSLNKCRHLHGHSGIITIHLEAPTLQKGMVLDFVELEWFKKFIDRYIDHRFLIDIDDPMLPIITALSNGVFTQPPLSDFNFQTSHALTSCDSVVHLEFIESFVIVPFIPTAENICKWIFDGVQGHLYKYKIRVAGVEFEETAKCRAKYFPTRQNNAI